MRKPLIAGNWKMYMDAEAAAKLVAAVCDFAADYAKVDVMLAPPFVHLAAAADIVKKAAKPVQIAAQNAYHEKEGAYTGEVSCSMLKSVGTSAVILGHSERRHIFGETDALICKKVHAVLGAGLTAIVCVGEQLAEREAGVASEVVLAQLGNSLAGLDSLNAVVIAYEPVWAIGTGKTASPEDAQSMHADIRAFVSRRFGNEAADKVRILYGGSVKPENIKELMACADIDGALVGGASLKADSFGKIVAM